MARPIASVILSVKNGADRLEGCIASLLAQKTSLPFEVHIIDSASTDGSYGRARRLVETRKLKNFFVWKERKTGGPSARNRGGLKARGEILLFTNADCQWNTRWLDELAKPLLHPSHYPLAAVGGVTENSSADQSSIWDRYLHGLFDYWERDRLSDYPSFLPWAPSCNFAVRADIFRAFRGFDERWGGAAYDMDFCWRLALCGFVVGHAPRARAKATHRHGLRSFLRRMEDYAYYNHALLAAYQKELRLPLLESQKEKLFLRSRRFLDLLRSTTNLSQASFRGLDSLVSVASLKGALEARVTAPKGDPKLSPARRGETPKSLAGRLPRGYSHLHQEGWAYWKAPSDVNRPGDLLLLKPGQGERFRLPERSWKIWEIKAEKGQSEDAAEALRHNPDDQAVLREIDELTIDLRSRRLLPS